MPASSVIVWIGAHEKELAVAAGAIGTVATVLWSKLSTLRIPKSWVAEDAKGPVAPLPAPIAPSPDLAEVVRGMAEWTMSEARARVRELEAVERTLRTELDRLRADLEDANADNVRLSRAVAAANLELERVRLEQDAAESRARRAVAELYESKHESASGFHGSAAITPLRPGKL